MPSQFAGVANTPTLEMRAQRRAAFKLRVLVAPFLGVTRWGRPVNSLAMTSNRWQLTTVKCYR